MEEKKNILTYEGLRKYEDELEDLKVNRRQEVAQKIKEAREQGDLSENAEYDAAKDAQRDNENEIDKLENILKNVEVVDEDLVEDHRLVAVDLADHRRVHPQVHRAVHRTEDGIDALPEVPTLLVIIRHRIIRTLGQPLDHHLLRLSGAS